jgi:hypothetical protein
MAKAPASRVRADYEKANLAAAKVILQDPNRYGPLMVEWAQKVMKLQLPE